MSDFGMDADGEVDWQGDDQPAEPWEAELGLPAGGAAEPDALPDGHALFAAILTRHGCPVRPG